MEKFGKTPYLMKMELVAINVKNDVTLEFRYDRSAVEDTPIGESSLGALVDH